MAETSICWYLARAWFKKVSYVKAEATATTKQMERIHISFYSMLPFAMISPIHLKKLTVIPAWMPARLSVETIGALINRFNWFEVPGATSRSYSSEVF